MANTPNTTTLSKLYFSESETGEKTQVAWVQEIPEFNPAPEAITYSSLDTDYEGQIPGRRKAETLEIPVLFTEEQHDELKAVDKAKDYYWFIQLPDETATTEGKALVFYFKAKVRLSMDTITVDEMLQEKIVLYRTGEVMECKGLPTTATV